MLFIDLIRKLTLKVNNFSKDYNFWIIFSLKLLRIKHFIKKYQINVDPKGFQNFDVMYKITNFLFFFNIFNFIFISFSIIYYLKPDLLSLKIFDHILY